MHVHELGEVVVGQSSWLIKSLADPRRGLEGRKSISCFLLPLLFAAGTKTDRKILNNIHSFFLTYQSVRNKKVSATQKLVKCQHLYTQQESSLKFPTSPFVSKVNFISLGARIQENRLPIKWKCENCEYSLKSFQIFSSRAILLGSQDI